MTTSNHYEPPTLTTEGNLGELTQAYKTGADTEITYPAGTPSTDLRFS